MSAQDVDALLVTDLRNVRYLSGFTGSAGTLLLSPEEDVLVTDGRYAEQAQQQCPDVAHRITRGLAWLGDVLAGGTALGVEGQTPWSVVRAVAEVAGDVRPVDGLVERLRERKDDDELALIREACRLSGEAFLAILDGIAPGRSERQVALELERTMVDLGADDRAFPSIVAAGRNGARPHHRPTGRRLERGDVVTLDFGALVDGYHADMTRVVVLGQPDAALRRAVEAVGRAQAAGVAAARAGIAAGEVDRVCREALDDLAERFVHGTGHGVGLALHEAPMVTTGASATLATRMVVTVEPGVYLPGLGGARIEDTVVVGPDGAEVLTAIPTDPYVR